MRFLVLSLIFTLTSMAATTIDVTTYGASPDSGLDATVPFQQAIVAASSASKPVTIFVPPGRYDFFTTNAHQRACYASNCTESGSGGMRTIALDITDTDDLTISAAGATFMMRGKCTLLVAERCRRFRITGATFDFANPPVREIKAVEKTSTYWVGEVHPDSAYQINGSSILWTGTGWSFSHNMCQPYDPGNHTTWRGSDPTSGVTAIEDLGNRQIKFSAGSGTLANVTVGRTYQFRNTYREQLGMWFNRCADVTLEDVAVRAMSGFGILGQFTENITYTRLSAAPDPASGRTAASAADILHFSGCKGLIRVQDSELSAAHDDAMNVHGTHLQIVATPASDQIKVRFKHAQTWGFQAFLPGDVINFVNASTLLSYASRTVTDVSATPGSTDQTLTLDSDNPAGITLNSDVVDNVTWYPSVEVVNCDISLIPTRGFLLTSRQPVRIEGCRFFRTQMHPILCENDAKGWFESGPLGDLLIRRNSFFECAEPTLNLNPENTTHAGAVHSNIRLEENDFTLTGASAVRAKSVSGLTLTGNRFRMRNNTTPTVASMVSTTNTTGLSIGANTVEPATTPALATTNGGFETPDVAANATGTPASWHTSGTAGILGEDLVAGAPASQILSLAPGSGAWQLLGVCDPVQGAWLNWSLRQRQRVSPALSSGQLEVGFFAWDGIYDPATGMPSASGMERIGNPVAVTALGFRNQRTARGAVDLTHCPAGTRVWMEIRAIGGEAALIDDVALSSSAAAGAISYATWAASEGLSGADADATADPENDGLQNLVEYAMASCDPYAADTNPLVPAVPAGNGLAWSYTPRSGATATIYPQFRSDGLASGGWQDIVSGQNGLMLSEAGGVWFIEVDTAQHNRCFFRLRVDLPEAPPTPLQVTGGDFGTGNSNGATTPSWYESGSTAWVEGTWQNAGAYPAAFPAGSGSALLMDNLGDGSYVYQKIGVLEAGHISQGYLRITADFLEKSDASNNTARFDVYLGEFPGAANGNDIFTAGLQNIGTFALDPAAQGLTAASGNTARANGVPVGTVPLAGLTPGQSVWLRICDAADGTDNSGSGGDLMLDNVSVEVRSTP
ncbi:MAG: hypothetical protein J0M04_23080 [Verrucomicrobia bacterium]|nr:hypothetical protein [Verrucomicrobiota bacterium]